MSYSSVILADTPIRYYRLDESDGTTAVDSGSQAQNGTLVGGVTLSQPGLLKGDVDTSMLFNGGNSYITCPTATLPTGASPWSIEAWCYVTAFPPANNNGGVIGFGTLAGSEMGVLFVFTDGSAGHWFNLSTFGDDLHSVSQISLNTVYHIVATYDGTTKKLYVNGGLSASKVISLNIVSGWCQMGGDGATTRDLFIGKIDEGAIYNYALTSTQVSNHYTAGLTYNLLSKSASKSYTRTPLKSLVRSSFFTRGILKTITRSAFKIRTQLVSASRDTFSIYLTLLADWFKLVFVALTSPIRLSFSISSPINFKFGDPPLAQPNSSIQVSVTAMNASNVAITNLSALTCVVTFPDGSISPTYSIGSGIINSGGGVYVLSYTTKSPGMDNELWTATDSLGNTAQYQNRTSVTY